MSFATTTHPIENDFNPITRVYLAGAVLDPDGVTHRPGAIAAQRSSVHHRGRAVAWGRPDAVLARYPSCEVKRLGDHTLLMPGLINAHSHLELSALGPRPYEGSFLGWLRSIRAETASGDWAGRERFVAEQVCAQGVEGFGDITHWDDPSELHRRTFGKQHVAFRELVGLGAPWDHEALAIVESRRRITLRRQQADGAMSVDRLGLSPHAPYSAGPSLYAAASEAGTMGVPVCTHLAETLEEARFVAHGDGPFLDLLKSLGKWDEAFASFYGRGLSPVRWMEPYLRKTRWLVAHGNYVDDDDLCLLAETGTSVAYCPVASAYFGHANHRYRDMLAAGINVCLGTDSIVCQPPDEPQPQSVLPQMRFLYRRDGVDPGVLFRMAMVNGRRALRLDEVVHALLSVPFDPSDSTGPLVQVLHRDDPGVGIAL